MGDSAAFSAINAIVAARSAHGLRNYSRRDEFIAQAETSAPQEVALRLMTQAELLLDEHRPEEALELLHHLPSGELRRHTGALKLEPAERLLTPGTSGDLRVLVEEFEKLAADLNPGERTLSTTERLVYADLIAL